MHLPRDEARNQYYSDPAFAALVNQIQGFLRLGTMTHHNLMQAAVLACQLHAEQNRAPITVMLVQPGESWSRQVTLEPKPLPADEDY